MNDELMKEMGQTTEILKNFSPSEVLQNSYLHYIIAVYFRLKPETQF